MKHRNRKKQNHRGRGWFNHPYEHALASKGIKTKSKEHNMSKKERTRPSKTDDRVKKEFDDIKELRNWLVKDLGISPSEIFVFGSMARGDYQEHSDIDIIANAMISETDDLPIDPFDWAKKYKVWLFDEWREIELGDSYGDYPLAHLDGDSKKEALILDKFIEEVEEYL